MGRLGRDPPRGPGTCFHLVSISMTSASSPVHPAARTTVSPSKRPAPRDAALSPRTVSRGCGHASFVERASLHRSEESVDNACALRNASRAICRPAFMSTTGRRSRNRCLTRQRNGGRRCERNPAVLASHSERSRRPCSVEVARHASRSPPPRRGRVCTSSTRCWNATSPTHLGRVNGSCRRTH